MARLPVITGFGGINAAGRSSGHHGYRRMILSALGSTQATATRASLAALTGQLTFEEGKWLNWEGETVQRDAYLSEISNSLEAGSLIRRVEDNLFNPAQLLSHRRATIVNPDGDMLEFELRKKHLPSPLPAGWILVEDHDNPEDTVRVRAHENFEVMLPSYHHASVNSAGQLPTGFDPSALYASRNHPRALQMTVCAASDAINYLGIDWEEVKQHVPPDQISVYAGSGMGQLDYNGYGGMLQARILGKKVSSKQLALGYAEMPADFVNAYLLGNLGTTGTNVAACATFLYNLRQGIRDIQSGSHRVAIIGTSEAPLMPEVFEGFATMGALADDASLRELDKLDSGQAPDYRRACRPFGDNCGFTLSESAQFVVLFDDDLAMELGANILGAVNEVYINADGHKKSIAGPGLGNYISMAKAVSATRNILGDEALRNRTYVQAHGTGTLQNRQTESHILSRVAGNFGIKNWPIAAIKSYIGHSLASSAGDQLAASLGVWSEGILPGILTTDCIADNVEQANLEFLLQHKEVGPEGMDAVLINSKGFGGNNASASILSPHVTAAMLQKRHGKERYTEYQHRNEAVQEASTAYDQSANAGVNSIIYKFDHNVLGSESIVMDETHIKVDGIKAEISLEIENRYSDMCEESK